MSRVLFRNEKPRNQIADNNISKFEPFTTQSRVLSTMRKKAFRDMEENSTFNVPYKILVTPIASADKDHITQIL